MDQAVAELAPAPAAASAPTLFDALERRLSQLIARFGVEAERGRILTAYRLLAGESLDYPVTSRPLRSSRINADGTPIQLALSLAASRRAPFRFLAEPGAADTDARRRAAAARGRLRDLAEVFELRRELEDVAGVLDRLAPEHDRDLLADQAGVYWLGAAFAADGPPALTVYVNARWGSESSRWDRFDHLAHRFGARAQWRPIAHRASTRMTPLGAAIDLVPGRPACARLYLTAFGAPMAYYRGLFAGLDFGPADRFARAMLGEDCRYPLPSTTCSFEIASGHGVAGAKFELCAHCTFATDAAAQARCAAWLESEGIDETPYREAIDILTAARSPVGARSAQLHAYVGVAVGGDPTRSSIYLNPGPALRAT